MKTIDLKAFRKANKISQIELAEFLEVGQSFISQIEKGTRPLPSEYISKLTANLNWDTSMLTEPEHPEVSNPTESSLVDYLERKVSDQEILIRELYQQIGMLEAKLDLARKGEIARTADGSSVVKAG
jgi:transcriptional regulator with XRE-family HTH domain